MSYRVEVKIQCPPQKANEVASRIADLIKQYTGKNVSVSVRNKKKKFK